MGGQRVIPMLSYEDAGASAEWVAEAFGFQETGRWADDDGTVTHVNMELDGGEVMLGLPSRDYQSPRHHAEVCEQARRWSQTPYIVDGVMVYVADLDAHYARATAAGAVILTEPSGGEHGRSYRAEDVEGHRWMFMEGSG